MELRMGNRESGTGVGPGVAVAGLRPVPTYPHAADAFPIPDSRFPIPAEGNA